MITSSPETATAQAPLFSIVVPVFNRERLLRRAIASCLRQDFADFELVVIDDGSTDNSSQVAIDAGDRRIRVIRQPANGGVSRARNAGVDVARGEWIVCLDSDDELVDGALSAMKSRIDGLEDDVDGIRFMCVFETGEVSPDPPLRGEVWDYPGYLRWAETATSRRQESLPCVRRKTFRFVRYPESRMLESIYHLDFARKYRTFAAPEIVRLYHLDAPDQLIRRHFDSDRAVARDLADGFEQLLSVHGDALRANAPTLFAQYQRGLATYAFLAGERRRGLKQVARMARGGLFSPILFAVAVSGLMGPSAINRLRRLRR